jgi:hypothetical protein
MAEKNFGAGCPAPIANPREGKDTRYRCGSKPLPLNRPPMTVGIRLRWSLPRMTIATLDKGFVKINQQKR